MLDKSNKKEIKEMIMDSLGEFFHKVLVPYFDEINEENRKEHKELRESIEKVGEDVYEIKDYIKDHEVRIRKLEKAVVTS